VAKQAIGDAVQRLLEDGSPHGHQLIRALVEQ